MGQCTSCLGGRRRDNYDEDDESRLLFDDPNSISYGSFGDQRLNGGQSDPMLAQREDEALQRVVARTSDNMVDIYEIAPHGGGPRMAPAAFGYPGQDAHAARYQTLLAKLSVTDEEDDAAAALAAAAAGGLPPGSIVDWLPLQQHDDTVEMQKNELVVKTEAGEPLVTNFADAAAAATTTTTITST